MTILRPLPASLRPAPGFTDTSDAHLVVLWLHDRSPHTQRAYRGDVDRFLLFVGKPLRGPGLRKLRPGAK